MYLKPLQAQTAAEPLQARNVAYCNSMRPPCLAIGTFFSFSCLQPQFLGSYSSRKIRPENAEFDPRLTTHDVALRDVPRKDRIMRLPLSPLAVAQKRREWPRINGGWSSSDWFSRIASGGALDMI